MGDIKKHEKHEQQLQQVKRYLDGKESTGYEFQNICSFLEEIKFGLQKFSSSYLIFLIRKEILESYVNYFRKEKRKDQPLINLFKQIGKKQLDIVTFFHPNIQGFLQMQKQRLNFDLNSDKEPDELISYFLEWKQMKNSNKYSTKKIHNLYQKIQQFQYKQIEIQKIQSILRDQTIFYSKTALNFIRFHIGKLINPSNICCRKYFYCDQQLDQIKNVNYSFFKLDNSDTEKTKCSQESLKFEKPNKKLNFQISKTIAGLLNQKKKGGGCLFFGISKSTNIINTLTFNSNFYKVEGINFSNTLKRQYLNYILTLLKQKIFPKHPGFDKFQLPQNHLKFPYEINPYITVQFLPIFNENTFEQQQNLKKCVCKIQIKSGHPQHFYHIYNKLSQQQNIGQVMFCVREAYQTKLQNFDQAFPKIHQRIQEYQKVKYAGNIKIDNKDYQLSRDCICLARNDIQQYVSDEQDSD